MVLFAVVKFTPAIQYRPHSSFAMSDQSNDSDDEKNTMKEID